MAKQKPSGWLDKYASTVAVSDATRTKFTKNTGLKKGVDQPVSNMLDITLSAPQRQLVKMITGKEQSPSEAMGIENPYGAFAADAILDPTNLVGAGLLGKAAKKIPGKVAKTTRVNALSTMLNKAKLNTELSDNLYANRILEEELIAPNSSFRGFTPDLPEGDLLNVKGNDYFRKDGRMYYPMEYGSKDTGRSFRFADVTDEFAPRPDELYPSKSKLASQKKYGISHANESMESGFRKYDETIDALDDNIIHNDLGKIKGDKTWWLKSEPYKGVTDRSLFDKPFGRHLFAKQSALESSIGRRLDQHRELMGNVISEGYLPSKGITITPTAESSLPSIEGLKSFNYNPLIKSFERGIFTKKKNGGWLDKFDDGGPVQPNYNDSNASAGPGFEGDGYSNVGRNYSPAWGGQFQDGGNLSFISNPKLRNMLEGYQSGLMQPGDYRLPEGRMAGNTNPSSEVSTSVGGEQGEPGYLIPSFKYGQPLQDPAQEFNMTGQHLGGPFKTWQDAEKFQEIRHQYVEKGQPLPSPIATSNMAMGGSMPGAVGFTYARVAGAAPSNGKYAKKTMASAQNGTEMEYYQNGLDWKPRNISKNGKKVIKDDRGQWDHPGEITEIGSNQITMQGVPYPVMGVSDTGDMQMMYPNQEYQYDGNSVTEYPMMQDGGELTKLDQLTNFTNYNTEQPGGWLEKYQDGGTVGNKWFPKEDLPVDVDVNAQAKTVTKKPAKQAVVPQPAVKSKGLSFEEIPTADDKKVIIDNFSKKYDYIVEGDKTYYRVKGGNTWDDVSDNKTAQKNLLQFIDKNDYWKGYNSGERELLYPNTTSKTAAPKPGVTPPTDETSFFDDLTTNAKGLINNTIVKPLASTKNIIGKKAQGLQKGTSEIVDDVVNSVKSGTNSAIKSTEDLSQTIMNGVTRKIKLFTGIGEDDVEVLTEADSKKPKSIKEWYGKGNGTATVLDTKDQDGRQYKQQVLPISSIKFGVRNREELKDINTEGMEITAFEPFSSNKKLPDNKTVLAIDSGGKLHTGVYKDFKNKPGFKVSETFVNKVMDLPDGKYKSAGPDNPGYQHPMAKILDDSGKVVDGSINVLVKNDSKKNFYGSIQGGRVLFVDPTTKEQYLVSGSAQHIRDTFKKIKGNNKYLEAYTLDNGTYARGLSYKDGKLTKERLNAYDHENTSGGNGLYIIDNPKPANRYQEDYVENMPNIRTDKDESFKKGHPIKNEIKNIILHHTAYTDPKLNEKQVKDQYMSPGHSSSHVVIEEDGKRTIYASPEQVTFHAGESKWNNRDNVNDFGVGVEFQGDTSSKPLTNAQIESFIEYYKPIASKYGLTAKDIITHQMIAPGRKPDITNKEYNRILKYMKSKNFK